MANYGEYAATIYEIFGPDTLSEEELAQVQAEKQAAEQAAEQQRNEDYSRINYESGNVPSLESTLLQQSQYETYSGYGSGSAAGYAAGGYPGTDGASAQQARARRVVPEILYDGQNIGLSEKVASISYTDNDQGKVDEVTLVFEDASAMWMMKDWIPERGHDLDVSMWFMDWTKPGDNQKYHCGNFTVDDLTYSGPPWTCTIKGVAILAESDMQTELKSKTWEGATLKQIVLEKMDVYGMPHENLYWYGEETPIEKVEQSNESDSAFLKKLCEKQGMYLKLYKKGMVVFDKRIYEPRPAKAGFGVADIEQGSLTWNNTLNGTYTGAILSYTNPSKKKNVDKTQMLTVQVGDCGEGARILRLNQHVEDEAEAQRIAIAKLNQENEKACTVSFRAMANVNMYATDNFMLSGVGRLNGKYYCTSVTHTLSRGGHTMTITGYRVWGRL